jgi:hypothetical protein
LLPETFSYLVCFAPQKEQYNQVKIQTGSAVGRSAEKTAEQFVV